MLSGFEVVNSMNLWRRGLRKGTTAFSNWDRGDID